MAPTTRKRKQQQDEALQQATQEASAPKDVGKQGLPVRGKDTDSSPVVRTSTTKQPGSQLISFDDEEENIKMHNAESAAERSSTTAAATATNTGMDHDIDSESDSDEDAAPEAISLQQAASEIHQTSKAAERAAQEQVAQQKAKRQQRDAFLKEQTSQRRKQDEEEQQDRLAAKKPQASGRRRRAEKVFIPDVLPAEYLTDSASEPDDEDVSMGLEDSQRRKRKRSLNTVGRNLTRLDGDSRDQVIGNTVYRVAKKTDERLPPKRKHQSQNTKKLLLKRNRTAVKPRAGFFTKG